MKDGRTFPNFPTLQVEMLRCFTNFFFPLFFHCNTQTSYLGTNFIRLCTGLSIAYELQTVCMTTKELTNVWGKSLYVKRKKKKKTVLSFHICKDENIPSIQFLCMYFFLIYIHSYTLCWTLPHSQYLENVLTSCQRNYGRMSIS